MVARVARAQLHAQYSWTCRDVWPGKNSWYWMAREQAWPPAEHSPSDPAPFVTTQADMVPSVASGGNVIAQDEAELDAAVFRLVGPRRGRVEAVCHVLALLGVRLREGVGLGRAEVLDVLLRRHDFRLPDFPGVIYNA